MNGGKKIEVSWIFETAPRPHINALGEADSNLLVGVLRPTVPNASLTFITRGRRWLSDELTMARLRFAASPPKQFPYFCTQEAIFEAF